MPWHRYARASHDSWAYRHNDTVVVRTLTIAKAILADRRFQQGAGVVLERTPGIDQRFLARRQQSLLLRDGPTTCGCDASP